MTIQRHHVSAGTFRTSGRQPLLLQAYLGTCVGLAICCRETGIGGIIHLLLPEPVSASAAVQPEKYASTGVPLFLDALHQMGARRETMAATLAGGALVGPISSQDLFLDIGGRTAESVRTVLAANGITIVQSETGGFFTCCLSLDMTTGQCTIEPVGRKSPAAPMEATRPRPDEIKTAMGRLRPIPQIALKVLRLIEEEDHGIGAIAEEIRKDQVITARALGLANSAMFAKKRPIESLDHALVYLGEEQLVKIILSAAVQSYFEQSAMGYSLCKGGLYHHALGCAHLAEILSAKTGKVEPYKAYTAGLLHDIGKVVLDQYVAPAYPFFYRQAMEAKENILAVERMVVGIDHAEVGHLLARQWSLPDYLADVIRHHHFPGKAQNHQMLTATVYLADLLLSRFRIGLELERLDTQTLEAQLAALDLGVERFAALVDLIPKAVFTMTPHEASPDMAGGEGRRNKAKANVHQ